MKKEIRLAGTGGQGIILAAIILAEAAVKEGYNVVQSQSYGAEARGGDSSADIIVSDDDIDYPKVENADILLAMTWGSLEKWVGNVNPEGLIILDSSFIGDQDVDSHTDLMKVPISALAKEKTGSVGAANMVALGVLVGLTEVVSMECLKEALVERVPASSSETNRAAMEAGFAAVAGQRSDKD